MSVSLSVCPSVCKSVCVCEREMQEKGTNEGGSITIDDATATRRVSYVTSGRKTRMRPNGSFLTILSLSLLSVSGFLGGFHQL